jgi:hypothetical protein
MPKLKLGKRYMQRVSDDNMRRLVKPHYTTKCEEPEEDDESTESNH